MRRLRTENKSQWSQYEETHKELSRKIREKSAESRAACEQMEKTRDLLSCCETQLCTAQTELSDCQQVT